MTAADLYRQAASRYTSSSVETSGPGSLLLLVFDKALDSIAQAESALASGGEDRIWEAHRALTRAQDIVSELQLSLDHDRGGDIASNLDALYAFCLDRLTDANLRKDATGLGPVTAVLKELRQGFAIAAASVEP